MSEAEKMYDEAGNSGRSLAFAPDSIRTGAVISFSDQRLIVSEEGIVRSVETRLTDPASTTERRDQWLNHNVPLLSRGDLWIVPLSWEPGETDIDANARRILSERSNELWIGIRGACSYRHGNQIAIDLSPAVGSQRSYASELLRDGVRRADWWGFGSFAVVLVVYGEPLPAPKSLIAIHVVPIGWVSERRPMKNKMPRLELSWSWADVVEFADASYAADSLKHMKEEGQGS